MKKILSISLLLAAALAFTACSPSEEDDIFDKSAAERLNEASDLYSGRLMASPNGWAMQLYPTTENEYPYGNGYLLLCRFNRDHSVNVSMDNVFSDNKYLEDTSLWEVLTDNGPVLSFNSHNKCIHAFSYPEDIPFTGDSDTPNDETGVGVGGDYEFIIVDAPEDASYMMLKGKKRGTYNLLTPIEVGVEYKDYLADVKEFQTRMFPSNVPTFNVLKVGETLYKMTGADDGIPNIFPYDGDEIIDESFNAFLVTKRGNDYYLRLRDEFNAGDTKVQEFRYNTERDVFESVNDPNSVLEGDNPVRFFKETIIDDQLEHYNWRFNVNTSDASESMKAILSSAAKEFSDRKMTLNHFTFLQRDERITLNVQYRTSKNALANLYFYYNVQATENGVTLSYDGYSGTEGNVLAQMPGLKSIVENTLSQMFNVGSAFTQFNQNNLTLTSASDPNLWVVVFLSKNNK